MVKIADRIKQLRKKKGVSQSQLAEAIGVKNNTVSTWERGTRKPDFDALQLLSNYFEVSFEYLLGSSDKECSLRSSAVAVPFLNGRFPTQNGRSFFNQVT